MEIVLYRNGLATVKTPLDEEKTSVILPIQKSSDAKQREEKKNQRVPMIETKIPAVINPDNIYLIHKNTILPDVSKLTELGEAGDSTMVRFRFLDNDTLRAIQTSLDRLRILYSDNNFGISWYVTHVLRLNEDNNTGQFETKVHFINSGKETRGPATWKLMVQEKAPIIRDAHIERPMLRMEMNTPDIHRAMLRRAASASVERNKQKQTETTGYCQLQGGCEPTSMSWQELESSYAKVSRNAAAEGASQAESYEITLQQKFTLPKQSTYDLTLFRAPNVGITRRYRVDLQEGIQKNKPVDVTYFIMLTRKEFEQNNLGFDSNGILPNGKMSVFTNQLQLLQTFDTPNFSMGLHTRIGVIPDNRVTVLSSNLETRSTVVDDANNEETTISGSITIRNQYPDQILVRVFIPYYRDIVQWDNTLEPAKDLRWEEKKALGKIVVFVRAKPNDITTSRFAFITEDRIKKKPPRIRIDTKYDQVLDSLKRASLYENQF